MINNIGIYISLFIFSVVLILLYRCKLINNKIRYIKNRLSFTPVRNYPYRTKCCVLLTMYVKNNKELYEKRVYRWLNDTNLDIYIVDSSGIGIKQKHERLHQYVFKQDLEIGKYSVSVYEKNSILKAIKYFEEDFLNYNIVFKITGKYFIPDFEKIITPIPNNIEIVLQNLRITHGQNTEIVGFKPEIIKEIIECIENDNFFISSFESVMYIINNNLSKYKKYRLPKIKLDDYTKRSDDSILYELYNI